MKNLCFIFRLGVLSYAMILLISCEPEDIVTTRHPTNDGIQDVLTTKKDKLEFIFDRAGRADGAHYIGMNPATGSKIEALLKGGEIYGFIVKKRDGKTIKLLQTIKHSSTIAPPFPPIGCPDGFDWRFVCYTHPIYHVKVCVSFCIANTLVLVTADSGI